MYQSLSEKSEESREQSGNYHYFLARNWANKRCGDRAASRINDLSREGWNGTLRINSQRSVVLSHGHQRCLFRGARERRPARSSLSRTAVHASGFLSRATPSPPAFHPRVPPFLSSWLHQACSHPLSLSLFLAQGIIVVDLTRSPMLFPSSSSSSCSSSRLSPSS